MDLWSYDWWLSGGRRRLEVEGGWKLLDLNSMMKKIHELKLHKTHGCVVDRLFNKRMEQKKMQLISESNNWARSHYKGRVSFLPIENNILLGPKLSGGWYMSASEIISLCCLLSCGCFSPLLLYFRCLNFKIISYNIFVLLMSTSKLLLFIICYLPLCRINFLSLSDYRNNYKLLNCLCADTYQILLGLWVCLNDFLFLEQKLLIISTKITTN